MPVAGRPVNRRFGFGVAGRIRVDDRSFGYGPLGAAGAPPSAAALATVVPVGPGPTRKWPPLGRAGAKVVSVCADRDSLAHSAKNATLQLHYAAPALITIARA